MGRKLNKLNDHLVKKCEESNGFSWRFAWLGVVIIILIAIY